MPYLASALIFAGLLLPAAVWAQEAAPGPLPAAQHTITLTAGAADYDLSGTGRMFVFAPRVTFPLTDALALEGGVLFAKPELQFGPSTIVAPEVQLQYNWRAGRFRPYAGGGIGTLVKTRPLIGNDWDLTLSAAGGTRVELTDRVGILGDFPASRSRERLRGEPRRVDGRSVMAARPVTVWFH